MRTPGKGFSEFVSAGCEKMDKYRLFDFHTHIYPDAIADKAVAALNKFYEFECECGGTYS